MFTSVYFKAAEDYSQDGSSQTVLECTCNKYPIWLTVHILWKITLLVMCLKFSWKTKSVSVPCLNDASPAFGAVFVSVLITSFAACIVTSIRGRQDAVYIISSIAISTSVISTQLILFLPKV